MLDALGREWWTLLQVVLPRSLSLLLLACGVIAWMRKASAAQRHVVWRLLLCSLLALPWLVLVLPRRSLFVGQRAIRVSAPPPVVAPLPAPGGALWEDTLPFAPSAPGAALPEFAPPARSPLPQAFAASAPLPAKPLASSSAIAWTTAGFLLWALGCVTMLVFLLAGAVGVWRLRCRSQCVTAEPVLVLAAEVARELGLRRVPALRQSRADAPSFAPMTWGILRPTVLLPQSALTWSPERLRLILLHEFAHVRRGDWRAQMLAQVVCALYWFHPLVWWAANRLRLESERACDDCVLLAGAAPPDYANTLIEVIRTMKTTRSASPMTVSMAGRPPIENRVRDILAVRRNRAGATRRTTVFAFVAAVAVLVPLASVRVRAKTVYLPATMALPAQEAATVTQSPDAKKDPAASKPDKGNLPTVSDTPVALVDLPTIEAKQEATRKRAPKPPPRRSSTPNPEWLLLNAQQAQAEASLQQAEASLQVRQAQMERARKLFEQGFVSQQQLETAQVEQQVSQAQINARQAQLERVRAMIQQTKQTVASKKQSQADVLAAQQREIEQLKLRIEALERQLRQKEQGGNRSEAPTLRQKMAQVEAERIQMKSQVEQRKLDQETLAEKLAAEEERYKTGQISALDLEKIRAEQLHNEADLKAAMEQLRQAERNFRPGPYINVSGGFTRPGKYDYKKRATMTQMVTRAGGIAPYVKEKSGKIFRQPGNDPTKPIQVIPFNLEDITKGKAPDIELQPGDIVWIPPGGASKRSEKLENRLEHLQIDYQVATQSLALLERQYQAGTITAQELKEMKARKAQLELEMKSLTEQLRLLSKKP